MRIISTLCLLLFFISCFSQVNDRIILSEYEAKNDLNRQNNISLCRMGGILSFDKNLSKLQESIIARDTLKKILISKISGVNALPVSQNPAYKPATIRMHCMATLTKDNQPLIVIDGFPVDYYNIPRSFDVNNIESITVLKNASVAGLYGCRASNGVILITTKYLKQRKFIIQDFLDGNPIAGATVSFISYDKKDTIMTAANDSGVVIVDKLKNTEGYIVSVTAIGFKLYSQSYKFHYEKEQTILLERLPKIRSEVVLSVIADKRRISCGGSVSFIINKSATSLKAEASPSIRSYPNPVVRGSGFNIKTENCRNINIAITGLDGKQIFQKAIKNDGETRALFIQTDPHWSAGIYFVQLYANGKLVASDKLVIR